MQISEAHANGQVINVKPTQVNNLTNGTIIMNLVPTKNKFVVRIHFQMVALPCTWKLSVVPFQKTIFVNLLILSLKKSFIQSTL